MSFIKYVILSVFVLLFSCTSNEMANKKALFTIPSSNYGDGFNESMTEEEILAYNNDQPILNQIECRLEAKSSDNKEASLQDHSRVVGSRHRRVIESSHSDNIQQPRTNFR